MCLCSVLDFKGFHFIQDVPHQTSATGAEYAVSTKATDHQYDDVKDKGPAPQGVRN